MPTPLNQTGSYEGLSLGLGTTAAHLLVAPKIKNKNTIVMVSIGASVQNQISERFEARVPELTNPKFKFVNLCQPAQDLYDWLLLASVWEEVDDRLATAGVITTDVQIAWLQDDIVEAAASVFPTSPQIVKQKLAELIALLKVKFTKLKHVYVSGRPYSGFTEDPDHDEPKGYHNGWACKWLVEDQINGLLPVSPWICDSVYMWTDGTTVRIDGFSIISNNYNPDGVHLSSSGKTKFGNYLFDQLKLHPVALKYLY